MQRRLIDEAFDQAVLELWDKYNQGQLQREITKALADGKNELAKQLLIHREIMADAYWAQSHEDFIVWYGLEALGDTAPDLAEIRDALRNWANHWGLNADWCYSVAWTTLHRWASDEETIGSLWYIGSYGGRVCINEEEELKMLPSKAIPVWHPFSISMSGYLKGLERDLRGHLSAHPLWASCANYSLKGNVDALIQAFLDDVRYGYCNKLIAYYEDHGHKRFNVGRRTSKHMRWTVITRIKSRTQSEVARAFQEIAEESGRSENAVKKAVKDTLARIGFLYNQPFTLERDAPKDAKTHLPHSVSVTGSPKALLLSKNPLHHSPIKYLKFIF